MAESARESADVIVRNASAGAIGIHGMDDEQRVPVGTAGSVADIARQTAAAVVSGMAS